MTTSFSSLPIVDVGALKASEVAAADVNALSKQLYDVFATTGFAYLVNAPLSFDHEEIFALAREFFTLPHEEKMKLAKKSFHRNNQNTYRGYEVLEDLPLTLTGADTSLHSRIWRRTT